jgi:hypothetical protein
MAVNKITWDRVGRVTEPGRYMYTFGWLTITAGDLEIWKQFPHAAFTLLAQPSSDDSIGREFHLGAFDISPDAQFLFDGTSMDARANDASAAH